MFNMFKYLKKIRASIIIALTSTVVFFLSKSISPNKLQGSHALILNTNSLILSHRWWLLPIWAVSLAVFSYFWAKNKISDSSIKKSVKYCVYLSSSICLIFVLARGGV